MEKKKKRRKERKEERKNTDAFGKGGKVAEGIHPPACIPNTRVNKIRLFFTPVHWWKEVSRWKECESDWLIWQETPIFTRIFPSLLWCLYIDPKYHGIRRILIFLIFSSIRVN